MQRVEDQRYAGARRSALLLLTACLALATAVALLGAGEALSDPGRAAARARPAAANAQLVNAFYAAVNDAVRTGNSHALDAIVAPAFAWCRPCPGQAPTRAGLKRYLADLRRTAPEMRVVVESVAPGFDDTVTARLHVTGLPLMSDPAPWGPIDTFRLDGGLIAERRSGPDGVSLVEPLLRVRLDALPPAVTGVALARLTFPPGAGVPGLLSAGQTLLIVESGALTVQIASGGRILRAGGEETGAEKDLGFAAVLHPGDAALIPPGVRHALHQYGAASAVAVGATFVVGGEGKDRFPWPGSERAPFVSPDRFAQDAPSLPPAVQHLAAGAVEAWPAGPVTVAFGRAVLGPDARVVPAAEEMTLLAVEAGTLGVAGDEDLLLGSGAGVAQAAGSMREVRNAGGGLLLLLLLTVAPVAE